MGKAMVRGQRARRYAFRRVSENSVPTWNLGIMALPADFIASLEPIHPRDLFEMVTKNTWPKSVVIFELFNEIRPVDLFCYLAARFGRPNGVQNFLRKDD